MSNSLRGLTWRRGLAEFVVIFAGVTLSLLADDWRQGREDAATELRALEAFRGDLRAESTRLETALRWMVRADGAALWLVRHIDDGAASEADVINNLGNVGFVDHYEPIRSAYLGARDSGQLGLVRDEGLRSQIIEYYELQQSVMLQLQDQFLEAHRLAGEVVRPHFEFVVRDTATSFWPLEGLRLVSSWNELRTADGFRYRLEAVGVEAGNWAQKINLALKSNAALSVRISEALAR